MVQPFRNAAGGRIDRKRPLTFSFDGRTLQGYAGDTLASALLANGVRLVGRSFKYHRPRGIFSAGAEEPNALVRLRAGGRTEPNLRATQVELFDGLEAQSQNRWPSLGFDLGAINGMFSRFMPAGFYYKTFLRPAWAWPFYERLIRKAAGMGRAGIDPDPDRYDHRFAHCDVLVVGGGPAGLSAAGAAATGSGLRVILADENAELGGTLLGSSGQIDGMAAPDWAAARVTALRNNPSATVLARTVAFGYYDDNLVALCERVADHLPEPPPHCPRQRIWLVRARQVVLATGAIERPLVFAGNDRPGVMLASAAARYVNQFAVRPGARAVVFTNNDSAYAAAADLARGGVAVAAIVDARPRPGADAQATADAARITIHPGQAVVRTEGSARLSGVRVAALSEDGAVSGPERRIDCDLLAVAGGWNPAVHLHAQARGRPVFDESTAAFVPGRSLQAERSAGAARGVFDLMECMADGARAGAAAAAEAGFRPADAGSGSIAATPPAGAPIRPLWRVPGSGSGKAFVDLQNDVTIDDLTLAVREGYGHVEHLKRYTALGLGTDQGRTSNVNGLALLAEERGESIPAVGTTTFRPPYTPIPFGAVAGREFGPRLDATRHTPMHDWHAEHGAPFAPAGLWMRPQYYPQSGEGLWDAIWREAKAVRTAVGLCDVSTLGKIDIQGRDAAEFLNRVYVNAWLKLEIGRCRYGVMLREDGMVMDDGTTSRIAEHHYLMTTTTVNAGAVMRHLEQLLQIRWPDLNVHVLSVTDEWAAIAVAGPHSRRLLERVVEGADLSNGAFLFMGWRAARIAGAPGRIFRISFSGELAYEVAVPADRGAAVWQALMAAGRDLDVTPYGVEALNVLRMEKGHVTGGELNGRTTADDLGFGRMVSGQKDFVGRALLGRPGLVASDRKQLVGLVPSDGRTRIPRGAQLVCDADAAPPVSMEGEVTSACFSPNLGHPIGLGLVKGGRGRMGETLHAVSPLAGQSVAVRLVDPVFIDPEGERLRG